MNNALNAVDTVTGEVVALEVTAQTEEKIYVTGGWLDRIESGEWVYSTGAGMFQRNVRTFKISA
jgi:hypothetical protein